jgi:hypothetical protein
MLELLNTRISSGDEATLGTLFDVTEEPKFLCYVLEDQFNEPKIPGETRIPAGRYEIEFRDEGGMVKFIYIHVGNKDDDTDGCLLVGDGQVSNVIERGTVTTSVAAYRRLYEKIEAELDAAEAVWITLEDYA